MAITAAILPIPRIYFYRDLVRLSSCSQEGEIVMRYVCIISGLMIVLMSESCTTMRPESRLKVPSPAEESIRAWQAANDIDLSERAFRLLLDQIEEDPCPNCSATYHFKDEISRSDRKRVDPKAGSQSNRQPPARPTSTSPSSVKETPWIPSGTMRAALRDHYLDQLRDINRSEGKRPIIKDEDILAYPFSAFLKDLASGLGGDPLGPIGRLIVQSKPSVALIFIDGKKKGYTEKRFVVNAGTYLVRVQEDTSRLFCEVTVAIRESETRTVMCPPR